VGSVLLLFLLRPDDVMAALADLLDLHASRKGYRAALIADCSPCSCCCCCCCIRNV
jgi:hypothetical protein